jgi:hypothetical protein
MVFLWPIVAALCGRLQYWPLFQTPWRIGMVHLYRGVAYNPFPLCCITTSVIYLGPLLQHRE